MSDTEISAEKNGLGASAGLRGIDQPASTAELILSSALNLFATHSYDGTSMRQIAATVGVKPASLYNHYAGKEDILWEIARRSQEQLGSEQDEVFESVVGTVELLDAFVRMHVAFHARWPLPADITNRQLRSLSEDRWSQVVDFRDRYERRLRDLLERGLREGVFDVKDTRITSYAILEMGMGISVWFRPDGPLSVEELCDLHVDLVRRMVGCSVAVAPSPGGVDADQRPDELSPIP